MQKIYTLLLVTLSLTSSYSIFAQSITNYAFTATSGTYTPLTGGTSMALSGGNVDEGYFNNIPIGFTFCYMGIQCNSISASTNGWLTFDQTLNSSNAVNNLYYGSPRPIIAPLWDDLDLQANTNFKYLTSGSSPNRIFTVEWLNLQWNWNASGNTLSFQVNLYESTGIVDFIYRDEGGTVNSGGASIGLTALALGPGNFLSLNGTGSSPTASSTSETTSLNTKPATGQKYIFTPPGGGVISDPINLTFTSVTSHSMTVNWIDNSTNENFFVVTRALDSGFTSGVVISYVTSTSTAGTGTAYNLPVLGLSAGVTYYFKVTAAREAVSSPGLTGSQATNSPVPMTGIWTINPAGSGDNNFTTFAYAISYLNANGVGSGGVTFNVADGTTFNETGQSINATGTSSNPIVFQKSGSGTKPIINFTGSIMPLDFGFKLSGCDYITFDGLDIRDAGTSFSNYIEFGVYLSGSASDGCKNNFIKNCVVDLTKANTSSRGVYTYSVATSSSGANSGNKFYNNTIKDCYGGYYIYGSSAAYDDGNEVNTLDGGISLVDNLGNNTASTIYAVLIYYQTNLTFANTIISNVTSSRSIYGIYSYGSNNTINCFGNEIINLTGSGAYPIYGLYIASGSSTSIYSNLIHGIAAPYNVYGLYLASGTINNIYNNSIYDINYTGSSNYRAYGLAVGGGTTNNIYNNFIYDIRAAAGSTGNPSVMAISLLAGTNINVFDNTAYLNYTSTNASNQSAALYVTASPTSIDLRNNIFVNKTTVTTGTRAVAFYKGSAVLTNLSGNINNNLYYAGTPGAKSLIHYDGTNSDQTLAAYKARVAPRDVNAVSENPPFVSSVSPYNLHMQTSVATRCESGAIPVTSPVSITTDIDGQTRNSTFPDIGADEFAGIMLDANAPIISYPLLVNSANLPTKSFQNVSILDPSGINITSGTAPRVYYKRKTDANTVVDNTSATNGWKWKQANGTTSPFDFTIDYALLYGGTGVTPGDTIQYFVVAQDLATNPFVGINAGIFAALPASVALTSAAFPITGDINYYKIIASINGDLTVGSGGTYPSLTGADGLFADINAKIVTGNITVTILSDLTETGTNPLNQMNEDPIGSNFSLTIFPDNCITRIISGNYNGGLIRLNGADRVTIDGRYGEAGNYLTFTNAATSGTIATIQIISLGNNAGASSNTIRNCNISTGTNTSGKYAIVCGGAGVASIGADNDNNVIFQNNISKAYVGIWAQGSATSNPGLMDNLQIVENSLGSINSSDYLGHDGIIVAYASGCSISQNSIFNIITGTATPKGITASTGFLSSNISRNRIHDLIYTGTGGWGSWGVYVNTGSATSNLNIDNNLIYNIRGDGWSSFSGSSPVGLFFDGATGGLNIFYNSVYMSGNLTVGVASITTAILFNNSSIANVDLRDNIFMNSMDNAGLTTDKNYAIYSAAPGTSFTNINFNIYFADGPQGVLGYLGLDITTLAAWQSATGQDTYSINTDPMFNSTTNLVPLPGSPVVASGTPIAGVDYDFMNEDRSDASPSMGAYESSDDFIPPLINYNPLTNTSGVGNRSFTNITIADVSGVDVTSGTAPRIYYKRSVDSNAYTDNTSATNGWKWAQANGTTSPFDFTIDYTLLGGGTGVTIGDTIQYFVTAQDLAAIPNVGINSGVFTSQPTSVMLTDISFPITGTINYYGILSTISGNLTVGAGGTYPSLTGSGGLFEDINSKIVIGNLTVTILSDLTETGINAINQFNEEPVGSNFTLIIRPDSAIERFISGNYSGNLIRLYGADHITVDGRFGSEGRYLTFINTATSGSVFNLISLGNNAGATYNTIRNCNISMGSNGSGTIGIVVGGSTSACADNDNNTIQSNSISKAFIGIWAKGYSSTNPGLMDNLQIIENNIGSTNPADYIGSLGINIAYGSGCSICQNTIYNIISTEDAYGIIVHYDFTSSVISRNRIHDITTPNANLNGGKGIYLQYSSISTNLTIENNLIYAIGGGGVSYVPYTSPAGLYVEGTIDGLKIYYNSILLNGSSTNNSSVLTTPVLFISPNITNIDVRDNIFMNSMDNLNLTTDKNYAIYSAAPATSFTNINYNNYFANGPQGILGFFGADKITISEWQAATGQDANSINSDPQFNSTTNLIPLPGSPVVAAGTPLAEVDYDYMNEDRSNTNPSIGAYENSRDQIGPAINYTLLSNTSSDENRIMSGVTITDVSGVDTTFANKPRIYYKRSTDANTWIDNTSSTDGWKYTQASGTTSPFDFLIDYSKLYGGAGVAAGDYVQYFIVAQDLQSTANVSINSGSFANQPASVTLTETSFPITGTINSYPISVVFNGIVNVGPAQTYTSLTADATEGLFKTLNDGILVGNLTVNITGNLTETGAVSLNQWEEEGAGNYTLTIQPGSASLKTISGSYPGGLIRLNGADRVTIDGSYEGNGNHLSFINTATTGTIATIQLISQGNDAGASNNTIRNCNLSTGFNTSGSYAIVSGGETIASIGADNDSNSILQNNISKAFVGIWAQGSATTNPGLMDDLQIVENSLGSANSSDFLGHDGIMVAYGSDCSISQNTIFNIITGTHTPRGITASTGFVSSNISRNRIHDLIYTGTGGWGSWGMYINTGSTSSNLSIDNNLIYNIRGDGWSSFSGSSPVGLFFDGATGGLNIYYNSVYMSGNLTVGVASKTTAILFNNSSIANVDLRNNIFMNSMDNAGLTTDKNYAIYSFAPNTSFTDINYNDYFADGPQGVLGYLGSDITTLADWQATTGEDDNSLNTDPSFLADTNLVPTSVELNNKGEYLSMVTEDFNGKERTNPPDIGAYEFGPDIVLVMNSLGSSANSFTCGYDNGNSTQLWYDSDINTIITIHRDGGMLNPSGYSGDLVYDVSYDGGLNWTSQRLVYTSNISGGSYNLDAARYPQGAIFNPTGNTDPDNAYVAYFAPVLDGSNGGTWGGYAHGVGKFGDILDTTKHLLTSDPINGYFRTIPKTFCVTEAGVAWMADPALIDYSDYSDHIILMKGIFNANIGDYEYEEFLVPAPANNVHCLKMAFDPTGQFGYIYWNDNNGSIPGLEGWSYPLFIKSSDFGETWSDVRSVIIGGIDGIQGTKNWLSDSLIAEIWNPPLPTREDIMYTTPYFNTDVAVDAWGNPHFITSVFVCGPGYEQGQYLTDPETFGVFDIYSTDQGESEWHAVHLGTLKTTSHSFGGNTEYNRTSVSSTSDGKCLFYTWLDTRVSEETTNSSPDIYARGFNLSLNALTNDQSPFAISGATNVTAYTEAMSQAYFQTLSAYCIQQGDEGNKNYTLPISYVEMDPFDASQPILFKYIQNFSFHDSDFVLPAGNVPVLNEFIWTGLTNQSWNNSDNWNYHSTPYGNSCVIIPGEPINQPILHDDITCKKITLRSGSELLIEPGKVLTVTDSLFIEPSISEDSTRLIIKGDVILTNGFPPSLPSNPNPPDVSSDQDLLVILSWSCSDPVGFSLFYDVYFGSDPNPSTRIASDIDVSSFTIPDSLNRLTTYYWKILAKNSHGNSIMGDTWEFTTTGWQNCGDSIYYEGKAYATVKIGNQCWMQQNLNVGTDLGENEWPSDNSIIEKWSYEYEGFDYGGYYDWNEMMKYGSTLGNQGICPPGWHVPTDGEWKVLEGETDSQYGIGDPVWDSVSYRGYDAGLNLKANDTWMTPGNGTDLYGFTALAAGYHGDYLTGTNSDAVFWTSTERNETTSFTRHLIYYLDQTGRGASLKWFGNTVRCIKNAGPVQFLPVDPDPPDSSLNQCRKITLGWSCINPAEDTLFYDVYFDTIPYPAEIIVSDIDSTTFSIADSLLSLKTYYWEVIAKDQDGNASSGGVWQFETGTGNWSCGDTVSYEGENYPTIQVGTQCWFGKNLNLGTRINAVLNQEDNDTIEKYCYQDNEENCNIYGGLYQWDEMMKYTNAGGVQGICPPGWHVPTTFEWCTLTTFLDTAIDCNIYGETGTDAGGKLKETGTIHWNTPNTGASNESGFTALPGGYRFSDQSYYYLGNSAIFWTSSHYSETNSKGRYLRFNYADIGQSNGYYKTDGLSVRCLADIGLNAPPFAPDNPNPPDSSTSQSTSIVLSWECSDLENNPLTYDVYLDTIPDPVNIIVSDNNSISYALADSLELNETYYWKVIAKDDKGNSTSGKIWQFTTREWQCGDSLSYQGRVYSSIQIGYQCWLQENLNVGERIDGSLDQGNNMIIEKYCYNDLESNCDIYGGLYQWDEMMQYSVPELLQGICPQGWHVATDEEWCNLSTYIDSNVDCNTLNTWSGVDVGTKMKSVTGWASGVNGTNVSGFTAIPGGRRHNDQEYYSLGQAAMFWTSTPYESLYSLHRTLAYDHADLHRGYYTQTDGLSVRCLLDINLPPILPSNPSPADNATNVDLLITLSWSCSDPENDSIFYDVYFDMNPVPDSLIAINIDANTFNIDMLLSPQTTYYWKIVAKDEHDSITEGEIWQFTTREFLCGDSLNYGGQVYRTIQIGNQCWMKENLNIGLHISTAESQHNNGIIEKYCWGVNETNCDIYGGLYQWDEMMQYVNTVGAQGICPTGWHIPSDADWCYLSTFLDAGVNCNNTGALGTDAGGKLKETGLTHWLSPNAGATNESGFTSLPGGHRTWTATSADINRWAYYWTSNNIDGSTAWNWQCYYWMPNIYRYSNNKIFGQSVRCLNDDEFNQSPSVPSNPFPPDGSVNHNFIITFSWSCSDPESDPLTFDILLDTIAEPETVLISNISNSSFTITDSLSALTTYYWKIIAHDNDGGLTYGEIWSFTTRSEDWQCQNPITISHVAGTVAPVTKTVTYNLTTNVPGEYTKCWITSNLGSDHQANSVNDASEASAGWYWQFNRTQGYMHDGTIRVPNTAWIQNISEISDWLPLNDPCSIEIGNGWRLPTSTEWTNIDAAGGWNDWNGPWTSTLKLHAAGYLFNLTGSLYYRGSYGYYWSCTQLDDDQGRYLFFYSGSCSLGNAFKGDGIPVRCIRE